MHISDFVANLKMKDRWWYLCLAIVCFLTEISGYQVPTLREVVRNATFVNGPPISNPPQTLNLFSGRQLFPFMNFTCNGTITRLTFLGWLSGPSEQFDITSLTLGPYFFLWRWRQHQYDEIPIGPDYNNLLTGSLNISRINVTHRVVEVTLTTNVMFSADDILGVLVAQRQGGLPAGNDIYSIDLLKSRGYGETPVCQSTHMHAQCDSYSLQEKPYIAIETGEM